MIRLLVTGFGSFPGAPVNPTGDLLAAIEARPPVPGRSVATHRFDTVYAEVQRDLPRLLAEHRPDILLMFGLANKATSIRIETTARNRAHRRVPDADGQFFPSLIINPNQNPAYKTSLDGPKIARNLRKQGIAAITSRNAGAYLCNFAYFLALEAQRRGDLRHALFVHVPLPAGPDNPDANHHITAPTLAEAAHAIIDELTQTKKPG